MTPTGPLENESTLDAFLRGFEGGSYPKEQWTHRAHVIMAAARLTSLDRYAALPVIREQIKAYNVAQGGQNTETSGYHESLTVFWIAVVADFLRTLPAGLPRLEKVRRAADEFGSRSGMFKDYWSFDVVASVEARREWIPPDRIELPW